MRARSGHRLLRWLAAAGVGVVSAWVTWSAVEKEILPDDWAFRPLTTPPIPDVSGVRLANPVDAFVRSAQQERGLRASPEADRRTLLRRLSFDLTGLPPRSEEIEAFLKDQRPDAFQRWMERYLASPEYGERWARHWLDVVRFGESQGFEYDQIREQAWPYRDYVIRSLNADKPYGEFVREQLAGDVLEPLTRDGLVATGFLVAGPWDQAGNSSASAALRAAVREAELEDMVGTVGQTFLGVTLNCARCHAHKFDPVPQQDYYRVKAVFQGIRHGNRSLLTPEETAQRVRVQAGMEADLARIQERLGELERLARERWQERSAGAVSSPQAGGGVMPLARWSFTTDAADDSGSWKGELRGGAQVEGGRLKLDGKDDVLQTVPLGVSLRAKTLEAWVALASLDQRGGSAMTLETPDGRHFDALVFAEREPGKWMVGSEFFRRTQDLAAPVESAATGNWVVLTAVFTEGGLISLYRDGVPYGESYQPHDETGRWRSFPPESRVLLGRRHTGSDGGFLAGEITEARLYDRALTAAQVASSAQAGPDAPMPTREALAEQWTAEERQEFATLQQRRAEGELALRRQAQIPQGYIANAVNPGPTVVFHRGEPDKPREAVTPGTLSALASLGGELGLAADAPEAERRRRFAEWVVDPRNALTARTIVNRVWQYHFGRGLVATPNDLGKMGERPSHPELLDWLAGWFVDPAGANGSLKQLHRLLLTSETWRQSGAPADPKSEAEDPDQRWLTRFRARRLEAEAVRDSLLDLSGELNRQLGGPGFRPFVHKGNGGQNEYFAADLPGPDTSRRTVYRIAVHSARDPLLDSLDCPEFSTRTPVRPNTTTPLQALSLMNNPFVQRMASALAERVSSEAGPQTGRQVDLMWRTVLGRPPQSDERADSVALVEQHGLPALAWTLMNANEFVVVR
jgi:Protein of unknown function (DUF1549)/Protein of unknown function (DUF1553)/Concanavalin A-like lectin/glucanases superfamily